MFYKILYPIIRPILADWLAGRALRIPAYKVHAIAVKLGIPDSAVEAVESEVAALVVAALDSKFGK